MVLQPGDPVPEVTATTQDGDRPTVEFVDPTVLFFFRSTDPSGCLAAVCDFDDRLGTYRETGLTVYAISTADVDCHRALAGDRGLDVPLLADPDAKVATAFGVSAEGAARGSDAPAGDGDGAGTVGRRTTFVCARRQVCGLYEGAAENHARDVLRDTVEFGLVAPPAVEQPTG